MCEQHCKSKDFVKSSRHEERLVHRRTRQGGSCPPPNLVRNINYSGNFYSGVGQSFCSCFVSLIFIIFSFHLSFAPCIKTHTKTQEMALKRLYFTKFSRENMPRTPLEVLAPSAGVGQIRVCPPKISKPVRLWTSEPLKCLNIQIYL